MFLPFSGPFFPFKTRLRKKRGHLGLHFWSQTALKTNCIAGNIRPEWWFFYFLFFFFFRDLVQFWGHACHLRVKSCAKHYAFTSLLDASNWVEISPVQDSLAWECWIWGSSTSKGNPTSRDGALESMTGCGCALRGFLQTGWGGCIQLYEIAGLLMARYVKVIMLMALLFF